VLWNAWLQGLSAKSTARQHSGWAQAPTAGAATVSSKIGLQPLLRLHKQLSILSNTRPDSGRRTVCTQCLRPLAACICACVQPVATPVQVLVLQHPLETAHPKGTARLLHLCLPGSRMETGEVFEPAVLQQWLHHPWPGPATPAPIRTLLLYPPTPPDPQLPLVAPPALPADWLAPPRQLRLVVIDGTWRKSRKMLYLNPALQQLPRLALHALPEGRYAIRKAHRPGQLSTLEATWAALRQLQAAPAPTGALDGLLQAMDALQAHYRRSVPQ